jgi:hypothetical protein
MRNRRNLVRLFIPAAVVAAAAVALASGGGSGWQPGPFPGVPPCNSTGNAGFECLPSGYCVPSPFSCDQFCRDIGQGPEVACKDNSGSSW